MLRSIRNVKREITEHIQTLELSLNSSARALGALNATSLQNGSENYAIDGSKPDMREVFKLRVSQAVLVMDTLFPTLGEGGLVTKDDDVAEAIRTAPSLSLLGVHQSIARVTSKLEQVIQSPWKNELLRNHLYPRAFKRLWLPTTVITTCGLFSLKLFQVNRTVLKDTLFSSWVFVSNAVQDWIFRPIQEMYETVRHRERRLVLMGARSLSSDLESLERMVVNYASNRSMSGSVPDAMGGWGEEQVRNAVRQGDLTVILRDYEREVQHPMRSALTGPLLTLMLIQVQKSKVDLELAMAALDKLLKANELNFGLLAVLPAMGITWGCLRYVRLWIGARSSISAVKARQRFATALWRIQRVLANQSGVSPLTLTGYADNRYSRVSCYDIHSTQTVVH
jgi:hypothetical protein